MFKQDCCLNYVKGQLHLQWWKMCVILFCDLMLIDFHQLMQLRLFAYDSRVLWCKFYSLIFYNINLYITDMISGLEVAPMLVASFSKGS